MRPEHFDTYGGFGGDLMTISEAVKKLIAAQKALIAKLMGKK